MAKVVGVTEMCKRNIDASACHSSAATGYMERVFPICPRLPATPRIQTIFAGTNRRS